MAEPFDVIVCGSGGDENYAKQFADWGQRLKRVLVDGLDHPESHVVLLTETGADGVSSREEIKRVLGRMGSRVTDQDDVFVYLIGHGNFRRGVAKLNVPGDDVSADDLDGWLERLAARRIVVINSASTSAAFINVLSGKGRVVCSSTRSIEERNATRFMAFFIQALEDGSADQNRDERVSVLEICRQASSLTEAWYKGEGYLATEHALLDDDGDGKGMRLLDIDPNAGDGQVSDRCFLLDIRVPPGTPKALVDAYKTAIEAVQVLVQHKAELDSATYYQQLETHLLQAARLNQQIRQKQEKKD